MRVIFNVSPREWDRIVRQSKDESFFQTRTWANIMKDSYGFEIATRLYLFDDGAEVLLPLMKTFTRFGFFAEYVSMPLTYGGFVSSSAIEKQKIEAIFDTFAANEAVVIGPRPLFPLDCGQGVLRLNSYTHILQLDGGFEQVWNHRVKYKRRNRCRKAQEMGVEIVQDCSPEAFKEYYSIYLSASLAREQTSPYPLALFEEIAGKPENIKLWLAKLDKKTIAGSIAFYNHQGLLYWSESTFAEFMHYHPADALVGHIIEDACNHGFKYIDFGGSAAAGGHELEGVRFRKENFGAERVDYSSYRWEGSLFRLGRRLSHLSKIGRKSDRA